MENGLALTPQDISRISKNISSMFRTEESFEEFYAEAKRYPRYRWISKKRRGKIVALSDGLRRCCENDMHNELQLGIDGNHGRRHLSQNSETIFTTMSILFRRRKPSPHVPNHFSGKKYAAATGHRTCWSCRKKLQAENLPSKNGEHPMRRRRNCSNKFGRSKVSVRTLREIF